MSDKKHAITIALDAMGGDHAPFSVVEGCERYLVKAAKDNPLDVGFIFYGNKQLIDPVIEKQKMLPEVATVIHTEEYVADDLKPSLALRQGKNTSMRLAINAVAEGEADGVVSAGNTGALMAMSKLVLKTLPGIARPAIASMFPSINGKVVMLDLGANVDCSAEHLFQFAVMGNAFAKAALDIENPRIGLLNIGSEALKGTDAVREAAELLNNTTLPLNYCGFVEGDDIPFGVVDVIVTDGFTGNVALKTAEGTARFCRQYFKLGLTSTPFTIVGAFLAKRGLKRTMKRLDPRHYNGAIFAGLNGIAIKSHGGADRKAFSRAVKVAVDTINNKINERIISELG